MKKKKTQQKLKGRASVRRKDKRSADEKTVIHLEGLVKSQSEKLKIKNGQLKNGLRKERLAEKQVHADAILLRKKDLEILKQREELMHVTRVGKLAEFVSSLAHEISQPLTAILSYAQAAQRMLAGKNPKIHKVLEHIINDDKRASDVITRLRTLLKKSESETEPLDINDVISETVTLTATDTFVRKIDIKTKLDPDLPTVLGDRVQLQQVILNLISNSYDALGSVKGSRTISIRTSRKNKGVIIVEVKDSGCGILKKDLHRIFSHFFTNKPDGLGMGLAISRSIVEAHGGKLIAKNNKGRGAVFQCMLPIYNKDN